MRERPWTLGADSWQVPIQTSSTMSLCTTGAKNSPFEVGFQPSSRAKAPIGDPPKEANPRTRDCTSDGTAKMDAFPRMPLPSKHDFEYSRQARDLPTTRDLVLLVHEEYLSPRALTSYLDFFACKEVLCLKYQLTRPRLPPLANTTSTDRECVCFRPLPHALTCAYTVEPESIEDNHHIPHPPTARPGLISNSSWKELLRVRVPAKDGRLGPNSGPAKSQFPRSQDGKFDEAW